MKKTLRRIDLPDVDVLVALFDPAHVFHDLAHEWFTEARHQAWATCPLTQSGLLQVVTNPAYPNRQLTIVAAAAHLRRLVANHAHTHHFLYDDTSLVDDSRVGFFGCPADWCNTLPAPPPEPSVQSAPPARQKSPDYRHSRVCSPATAGIVPDSPHPPVFHALTLLYPSFPTGLTARQFFELVPEVGFHLEGQTRGVCPYR